MDWLDLRNHLVEAHGEAAEAIDDMGRFGHDAAKRRSHADNRHRALHDQAPDATAAPPDDRSR